MGLFKLVREKEKLIEKGENNMEEISVSVNEDELLCCKCGKNMNYKGSSVIGVSISLKVYPDFDDKGYINHIKKQLGKYEIGKDYNFCCECWLDSLFNNEKEKK